ncbi:MAG TPA: ferrous iron transport protein A [Firmicutes bacterium]|nr:ferrous iron transport protein A [Bacillota bacterium]
MTLNELKIGQSCKITKVNGEGALRKRLLDMGLTPKTKVTLHKTAPMGDPIELLLRGYNLTIRKEEAARIEAEVIE